PQTRSTRQAKPPWESLIGTSTSPSTINYQPSTLLVATSRYRHDALPCVHQVEREPPHLSSIQEAPRLDVRSSAPPFPLWPRQPAHLCLAVLPICLRQLLSIRRRISSAAIPPAWRSVSDSPLHLHLLPAKAMAFHFLLRPDSVLFHPAVFQATVRADSLASFRAWRRRGAFTGLLLLIFLWLVL